MPAAGQAGFADYDLEAQQLLQRQKMAELLQQQGEEPGPQGQMIGRFYVAPSWTQNLAHALKGPMGAYEQLGIEKKQKALGERYRSDVQSNIEEAQRAATGTPAGMATQQVPGASGMPEDFSSEQVATPEVKSDMMKYARILSTNPNPAVQAMGLAQMQAEMANRRRAEILRTAFGQPENQPQTYSPAVQNAFGVQGPAPAKQALNPLGIPTKIAQLMTSGDPELVALGKTILESSKGIAQRPGAPVVNPFTGEIIAQPTPAMAPGMQLTMGPQGNTAAPVPGYAQGAAALTRSQEETRLPFAQGITKVTVSLPGGDQRTAELNPTQYHYYNTTGALPPEIAAGIPGYVPPQQPQTMPTPQGAPMARPSTPPQGAPQGPPMLQQPQGVPAPQTGSLGWKDTADSVIQDWQTIQKLPANSPQEIAIKQQAIDSIRAKAANLKIDLGGTVGRPIVGLGQTQNEAIEQEAQKRQSVDFAAEKARLAAEAPGARAAVAESVSNLQRVKENATAIMNDPALERITGLWGQIPNRPGGPAADVKAKLDTLKAQIGFGVLSALKAASKTGGALGSVSDKENELLQGYVAALDKAQSLPAMRSALGVIVNYVDGAAQRMNRAYQDQYERVQGTQGMQITPGGAVPLGTRPAQQGGATGSFAPAGKVRVVDW
jgi:hypothetical protein